MSTKALIIDTTIRLVSENGISGTSTALIARESGIATGTLFHHFPDKKSLLALSYLYIQRDMSDAIQTELFSNRSRSEQLAFAWDAAIDHIVADPDKLAFSKYFENSTYNTALIKEKKTELYSTLMGLFAKKNTNVEFRLRAFLLLADESAATAVKLKGKKKKDELIRLGFSAVQNLL